MILIYTYVRKSLSPGIRAGMRPCAAGSFGPTACYSLSNMGSRIVSPRKFGDGRRQEAADIARAFTTLV